MSKILDAALEKIRKQLSVNRRPILIGLAFTAAILFWLGMGRYGATKVENEVVEEPKEEAEDHEVELRERLYIYCGSTANPETCKEIAGAGIGHQRLSGIGGLAEFVLAVASNESRFLSQYCTGNNCLGLGASNPRRHMSFDSHSASVGYLAKLLLNRYGKRPITPSGVWEIASWYAGSSSWAKRILWFMERF